MSDVIKLLPDSIANQIAAGEVVQRPASVVKELMENAVDAASTSIVVNICEGGRELIHIIDNGCGISENDAIKAFERHATSKISNANDLYNLSTFGFRGEALASIASVAEVELRTKKEDNELGTRIRINAGEIIEQSAVNTPKGSQFFIKNLFYNIPARRKFLKSNSVETKHILTEFSRIALCNPNIEMMLYNNDTCIYNLPATNSRQRIVAMMGKHINASLLELSVKTSIISIEGFIGTPQSAKKSSNEQYLFINDRYFKSPYFHKAVMMAYDKLIQSDVQPSYFLYMKIDPSRIDVNIHPAKTEIKFEDEQAIWQILNAAVRESLGKLGAVPLMDFDNEQSINIPVFRDRDNFKEPVNYMNEGFNPFDETSPKQRKSFLHSSSYLNSVSTEGWETLYKDDYDSFDSSKSEGDSFRNFIANQQNEDQEFISAGFEADSAQETIEIESELNHTSQGTLDLGINSEINFLRINKRHIATQIEGRLFIIDILRAHNRILYEQFIKNPISSNYFVSQQELFAQPIKLSPQEIYMISQSKDELLNIGFDIEFNEANSIVLKGIPADMSDCSCEKIIDSILSNLKNEDVKENKMARIMAETHSMSIPRQMADQEIKELIIKLLDCKEPLYTTKGKMTMTTLTTDDIIKRLSN